jgi:hypothetical protein
MYLTLATNHTSQPPCFSCATNTDTMAAESSSAVVSTAFLEGLALDVSILESLLKRHRTSHGRTLYYRRMAMAFKSVQSTYNILGAVMRLEALQKEGNQYVQEEQRKKRRNKKKQKDEEQWSLEKPTTSKEDSKWTEIDTEMEALMHTWTLGIREIISRIHHASRALFLEISRGFFLPFCTVGVSALARIRSMLLEIGRRGLTKLKDIQSELTSTRGSAKWLSESDYQLYMSEFLGSTDPQPASFGGPQELDRDDLLSSLGLMPAKQKTSVDRKGDVSNQQIKELINKSLDDQDFGEAIVAAAGMTKTSTTLNNSASNAAVESNMAFVESLQRKQKGSKITNRITSRDESREKASKKRKSTPDASAKDSIAPKKKKKPKKKSKGNFFDELFDT